MREQRAAPLGGVNPFRHLALPSPYGRGQPPGSTLGLYSRSWLARPGSPLPLGLAWGCGLLNVGVRCQA